MKEQDILDSTGVFYFLKKEGKYYLTFPFFWFSWTKLIKHIKKIFKGDAFLKKVHRRNIYLLKIPVDKFDSKLNTKILNLSSRLNHFPIFSDVRINKFANSKRPILSIVILVNTNIGFVLNLLIPSLIKCTCPSTPYEIFVVFLGETLKRTAFPPNIPVYKSYPGWISRAYNLGITRAKGKYIALFHDDCIMNDTKWVEKSISNLNNNNLAVTPEIQKHGNFLKLKSVPLVMEKEKLMTIGKFDQRYIQSNEDLDLTFRILSLGYSIKKIKLKYYHYEGMTSLSLHISKHFGNFFDYNFIPKKIIKFYKKNYLASCVLKRYAGIQAHDDFLFHKKWEKVKDKIIKISNSKFKKIVKNQFSVFFNCIL